MKLLNLSERNVDKKLNIKTRGLKEPTEKNHYRYEATPYRDLNILFENIQLKETDHLLDIGSGKGRICFYVNYLFNCHVEGVEADPSTYNDSLVNLQRFNQKYNKENKIKFINEYAERFLIDPKHNVFFFFNPFDVHLFKKVIYNILASVKRDYREITIILAFPFIDYAEFILEIEELLVVYLEEYSKKKEIFNKFLVLRNY